MEQGESSSTFPVFPVTYQPYQFIIKISDFCLDNWATIICRILSGLSLIISMTVWERRKTFNTVTEHKTTGSTKIHIQRFELIRPGQFILMPATTRPRPHSWKMLRRRAAKSWMVLVCPVPEGCSDWILDRTEGSTGCDAKRIKGDYPGRKWEGADGMIL